MANKANVDMIDRRCEDNDEVKEVMAVMDVKIDRFEDAADVCWQKACKNEWINAVSMNDHGTWHAYASSHPSIHQSIRLMNWVSEFGCFRLIDYNRLRSSTDRYTHIRMHARSHEVVRIKQCIIIYSINQWLIRLNAHRHACMQVHMHICKVHQL